MKEIVTLQFGGSANAVANRFWGLQADQLLASGGGPAEVDHSVLHRRSSSVSVGRGSSSCSAKPPLFRPDSCPVTQGWRPRTLVFDDRAGVAKIRGRNGTEDSESRYDARDVVAVGNSHEAGAVSSWASDGSAFTAGRSLVTEDLLDHFRGVLEACDAVTGIQTFSDVTSGFGSFAAEFLVRVREECPRAALVVLGVAGGGTSFAPAPDSRAAPASHEHKADAASSSEPRPSEEGEGGDDASLSETGVHARYARSARAVSLALAFSAFGGAGGELGALFVPACPSALLSGAGGGGGAAAAAADFAVAAAWDTLLLPLRRSAAAVWSEARGDVLACSRGAAAYSRAEGQPVWARVPPALPADDALGTAASDGRAPQRDGGGGGSGRSAPRGPPAPLAALGPHVGLPELVGFLRPSSTAAVASLALALDSPSPAADARGFAAALTSGGRPPAHLGGFAAPGRPALQVSWLWASRPPPVAAAAAGGGDGRASLDADAALRPHAHVLVARGVGGLAMADAAGSRYAAPCAAYGEAMDAFLGRSLCARAAHALLRSPLCMPADIDAVLSSWRGAEARGAGLPPPASITEEGLVRVYDASEDRGGGGAASHGVAPGPGGGGHPELFAVPLVLRSATAHAQSGPAYGAALSRLQLDFSARDPRMFHLFSGDGGAAGGGDAQDLFAHVQEDVARLVDEYCL